MCGSALSYRGVTLLCYLFGAGFCITGFEIVALVFMSEMGGIRFRKLGLGVWMLGWGIG